MHGINQSPNTNSIRDIRTVHLAGISMEEDDVYEFLGTQPVPRPLAGELVRGMTVNLALHISRSDLRYLWLLITPVVLSSLVFVCTGVIGFIDVRSSDGGAENRGEAISHQLEGLGATVSDCT